MPAFKMNIIGKHHMGAGGSKTRIRATDCHLSIRDITKGTYICGIYLLTFL